MHGRLLGAVWRPAAAVDRLERTKRPSLAAQRPLRAPSRPADVATPSLTHAGQYCYRCGNQASILEVGENGQKKWNVFSAAPENDTDGPNQAAAQMAKVR